MSHIRVKTTYEIEGGYGSSEILELYCHHNGGCDSVVFYDNKGEVVSMVFDEWIPGNGLWSAMNRLYMPFVHEWGGKLKGGVEYYTSEELSSYPPMREAD